MKGYHAMSKSEIARLRQQIELESAAMKLALYGFAAVGKHEFISHKYDAIGKCQEQLERLVGEEKASDITIESYNHIMESDESIRLPDGFEMVEMYDRCHEQSLL